ncbi:RNA-directed DNA polymerase, eukaryota, reverse transcriptase zinc-binding domain protein [Tanacetum coccineum]
MSNNTLSNPTRWNKILPLKINIFSWRTSNTRLPTRLNLDIRGVDLHTIRCPICDDALESEEQLFVYCELAKETLSGVVDWWKLSNVNFSNLQDVISLAERAPVPAACKMFFDTVVQSTIWHIWRFRNEMVFNSKRPNKHIILDNVKLSTFNWITYRQKKVSSKWIEWICDPCNAISSLL